MWLLLNDGLINSLRKGHPFCTQAPHQFYELIRFLAFPSSQAPEGVVSLQWIINTWPHMAPYSRVPDAGTGKIRRARKPVFKCSLSVFFPLGVVPCDTFRKLCKGIGGRLASRLQHSCRSPSQHVQAYPAKNVSSQSARRNGEESQWATNICLPELTLQIISFGPCWLRVQCFSESLFFFFLEHGNR